MRKYVHKVFAKSIANIFCITGSEKRTLIRVATELDRLRGGPEHHHSRGSLGRILNRTLNARKYYLSGNLKSCTWNLGVALHLAQDVVVPSARYRRRHLHDKIETGVERLAKKHDVAGDLRQALVNFGYPHEEYEWLKTMLHTALEGCDYRSAHEVYKWIVELTVKIACIVFGPKLPPSKVTQRLNDLSSEVLKRKEKLSVLESTHRRYVRKALAVLAVGLAISFSLTLWLSLATVVTLAATVVISLHVLRSDKEFYEIKKQYKNALKELKRYKEYVMMWYTLPGD